MAYIRSAAVISGFAAHALDRLIVLRVRDLVSIMPPDRAREVDAALRDIRRAAEEYLAMSADMSADTKTADISPQSTEELIGTRAAAGLLGLTERQVRRLAAAGLGTQVNGTWMFDRRAVHAELQRRNGNE